MRGRQALLTVLGFKFIAVNHSASGANPGFPVDGVPNQKEF